VSLLRVETTSRWETSSLLRKLHARNAYAVQLAPARWLVLSPIAVDDRGELEALVAEWAAEEGAVWPTAVAPENGPVE
jgi:hypothetical protein